MHSERPHHSPAGQSAVHSGPSATFTPMAAGLRQAKQQDPQISTAMATLITEAIKQDIAQGLQQRASSEIMSDYVSRLSQSQGWRIQWGNAGWLIPQVLSVRPPFLEKRLLTIRSFLMMMASSPTNPHFSAYLGLKFSIPCYSRLRPLLGSDAPFHWQSLSLRRLILLPPCLWNRRYRGIPCQCLNCFQM